MAESFSEKLLKARRETGLSQKKLADRMLIPCYNNSAITENSALINIFGVGVKRTFIPQRLDLCPDCYQRFINWIEKGGAE